MPRPTHQCVCCRNTYSIFHVSRRHVTEKDKYVWVCHSCELGIIQAHIAKVSLANYTFSTPDGHTQRALDAPAVRTLSRPTGGLITLARNQS